MITKCKYIKNVGKFYDYSAKGDGLDWHKNTFFFAPNAYGKSTLVDIIRSLHDDDPNLIRSRKTLDKANAPEAVIVIDGENHVFSGTRWDRPVPDIKIFDMPFIHANILAQEIEHEHLKNIHKMIIGTQGVTLAKELVSLKAKLKDKNKEVAALVKQFNSATFTHHTLDTFLAIPDAEETAVDPRIQKLEQALKSKESELQIRGLGFPQGIYAPTYDVLALKSLVEQKLAVTHEAAEKRVLAHIDQNFKDKAPAKEFIRQGLDLMQEDCPFCGQDLKSVADLLKAYSEFFDDAFRIYQQKLATQAVTLAEWNLDNDLTILVSVHNANLAILRQWEPYIGAEALPDIAGSVETFRPKLSGLKAAVQGELDKKQKDPNADVDLSQFDVLAEELAALKTAVASYNVGVVAFIEKAKQYVANLPKADVSSIQAEIEKEEEIKKRFSTGWKEWATDYLRTKGEIDDLLRQKNDKQTELENYTKTIFENYQKRINELLLYLGADFAVTDLTSKTDDRANESYTDFGFLILKKKVPISARQDDAPCFKNTLSEGDKSTLAFAFFIASLERTPELDKQIVVFDDPLSSLDDTRREATARLLLELTPKLNQLCVCTHKKDFLYMLCDKMQDNKVLQVRSDKKNGSQLDVLDVEEDRKSDHVHRIEDMEHYLVEDFGPSAETMQGNLRKLFETVLKTKYYRAVAADIKAKHGFATLLTTLFSAELLDTALESRLFDLCSVTNGPHHGEIVDAQSRKLTRDELIPLIREALALMEKV